MTNNSTIELRAFRTWMESDGIARSYVLPNAKITIEDAIENSAAVNSLYKGIKFPLLVNIAEIGSITKDARSHFAIKDRKTNVSAFALVVKSEISTIIGNLFFTLTVSIPAKMFTSELKALEWLERQKQI